MLLGVQRVLPGLLPACYRGSLAPSIAPAHLLFQHPLDKGKQAGMVYLRVALKPSCTSVTGSFPHL